MIEKETGWEPILRNAFRNLNNDELELLLYHRRKGTKLLCGAESYLFVDGAGGG
jgi:hypothetical protein